jgi:hypothetical protein
MQDSQSPVGASGLGGDEEKLHLNVGFPTVKLGSDLLTDNARQCWPISAAAAPLACPRSPAISSGQGARIPHIGTCAVACHWAEAQVSLSAGKPGKWADVVSQACASPFRARCGSKVGGF